MANKTQWVVTLPDVLRIAGHAVRAGERSYLSATGDEAITETFAVTKIRVRVGATHSKEDMDVYTVTKAEIEAALVAQGEVLPRATRMFVKQSDPTGLLFDEVWITEDTVPGSL